MEVNLQYSQLIRRRKLKTRRILIIDRCKKLQQLVRSSVKRDHRLQKPLWERLLSFSLFGCSNPWSLLLLSNIQLSGFEGGCQPKMWLPMVHYCPMGINNSGMQRNISELYQVNTKTYLEEERAFIYKGKWVIGLTGPFYQFG